MSKDSSPTIISRLNLRRLIPLAVAWVLATVMERYKEQGELAFIPDWGYDLALVLILLGGIYWLWTQPDVRSTLRLVYDRWPKMLTPLLIIVGILIGGSLGAFGAWRIKRYWQRQETKVTAALETPTFTEDTKEITIALGANAFMFSLDSIRANTSGVPLSVGNLTPIQLQVKDNKLYANCKVYGGSDSPVEIIQNVFKVRPANWDINSNGNALEVVNQDHIPVFQIIYKRAALIQINGIFQAENGKVVLASEQYGIVDGPDPKMFADALKPIFKYPAWKHRGEYAEPSPVPEAAPSGRVSKIERKGTRGIRLPLDPETHRITSSSYKGEENNLVAYLAKFYYTPEPNTPDWVYVTAHIYFYYRGSTTGTPLYRAFRPVWFETESNKQVFKRAETHELIIVMGGDELLSSYESSDKEGHFHYEGVFEYEFTAQVELIIERDQDVTRKTYNYELIGKRRPNDPIILKEA